MISAESCRDSLNVSSEDCPKVGIDSDGAGGVGAVGVTEFCVVVVPGVVAVAVAVGAVVAPGGFVGTENAGTPGGSANVDTCDVGGPPADTPTPTCRRSPPWAFPMWLSSVA